jgi:hypothetical protein
MYFGNGVPNGDLGLGAKLARESRAHSSRDQVLTIGEGLARRIIVGDISCVLPGLLPSLRLWSATACCLENLDLPHTTA